MAGGDRVGPGRDGGQGLADLPAVTDRPLGRVALGLLAIVVLAGIGVAGVVMVPADGADQAAVVESGMVERADVDLVAFRDPEGGYEISVPDGWVSMSFDGDVSELGERAFPDDPELADEFQELADSRPASLRFMSVDPDEARPREPGSIVVIERGAARGFTDHGAISPEARRAVREIGGDVTSDGTFMTAGGQAVRVAYDLEDSVSGIQYLIVVGDDAWTFTYTSRELPEEAPVADAVAASFAPG